MNTLPHVVVPAGIVTAAAFWIALTIHASARRKAAGAAAKHPQGDGRHPCRPAGGKHRQKINSPCLCFPVEIRHR